MQTNLMEETTEMTKTIMQLEAREAPARILQQLQENRNLMAELGAQIRQFNPQLVMTVGRGSSDHAGVFAKYLVGIEAGRPAASAMPSIAGLYGRQQNLSKALVIVISQSGRSPDILAQAEMAKQAGAFCVALVNDETSPLRDIVDAVVPLKAGPEKAVAATKSFLTTLSAIIHLVAEWTKNAELLEALTHLPLYLEKAIDSPAQLTPEDFKSVDDCVVLARGLGYGIAREIALKLKEVCGIHAESFSSAEFLHGPVTLVETKLTILDVLVKDEAEAAHVEQIEDMKRRGADLVHLNQVLTDVHPRLAPLLLLQRFYLDVEKIALARGVNPDAPPGLNKVTRTR
tara:strand:+ start:4467 stop:5498 length:1032 start_codon:yes stop_codon:yes gene_type:complete